MRRGLKPDRWFLPFGPHRDNTASPMARIPGLIRANGCATVVRSMGVGSCFRRSRPPMRRRTLWHDGRRRTGHLDLPARTQFERRGWAHNQSSIGRTLVIGAPRQCWTSPARRGYRKDRVDLVGSAHRTWLRSGPPPEAGAIPPKAKWVQWFGLHLGLRLEKGQAWAQGWERFDMLQQGEKTLQITGRSPAGLFLS
jgi:hypothetical protein